MRESKVLKKARNGERILCAKSSFYHPEIVEMLCRRGFDAIWICLEHRQVDPSLVTHLIRICRLHDTDAIIRVNPANDTDLLWLLEAGANGIMLPRAKSVETVERVAGFMKFPPHGTRGFDGVGPDSDYGSQLQEEYMEAANRETFLLVQIEEPEILPHIGTIAELPGVDMLFIGPKDLTLNLGVFNAVDDPEIRKILEEVSAACRKNGKVACLPASAEKIPQYEAMGYQFFNVTSDFQCLKRSLEAISQDIELL